MRIWLAVGVAACVAVAAPGAGAMPRLLGTAQQTSAADVTPAISAPADVIVSEGDLSVNLTVTLSAQAASPVAVTYSTHDSSATAFADTCTYDYIGKGGTLTFAAGEVSKTVKVDLIDCANAEPFESFTFGLSGATGAPIARTSTRVSIVDNDNVVPSPRLFVRDAVVDEMDGTAHVSVLMGGPGGEASVNAVTVDYATSNGTATGSDYGGRNGQLTFDAGHTVATVDITIDDDAETEPAEQFTLTLSNPTGGATIADGTAVIVIGASDASSSALPSVLAPRDVVIGEGDGFVDLAVILAAPGLSTATVRFGTGDDTATSFAATCTYDYLGANGTLTFAPGETTKVVRVEILDCPPTNPPEGFESFSLDLALPSGTPTVTIASATTRVSIIDNDTLAATPKLLVRDAVVDEKEGAARISVLLGGPTGQVSAGTVTVHYATNAHSATSGSDYTAVDGTLSFAPGQTVKTVVVPISDDDVSESAEDFLLTLSSPSGATLGDGTAVVVIGANDGDGSLLPAISVPADTYVGERDGFVDLVVSLSSRSPNPVSVTFATHDVTAISFAATCTYDYMARGGRVTFAAGETTKVVRVEILDCPVPETLLQSFTLDLSSPSGGTIARASTEVTIVDNDFAPSLTNIAVAPGNPTTSTGGKVPFTATGTYMTSSATALPAASLTASVLWTSSAPSVATIDAGGLAHAVFPGTSTVAATAPLILALGPVTGSTVLTVDHSQSIVFVQPGNKTYLDADFAVNPTASSGLAVTVVATGNCTVSGTTVHLTGAGSCTLTGSQSGDVNFNPAPDVPRTFTIAKHDQTLAFGTLAGKTVGDPDFAISAAATSGLAVGFSSSATGVCTTSGATVHLTGAGTCTITATQGGNANYNAATSVSQSFTVAKGTQSISFDPLPGKTFGDGDFAVGATASSGLAVTFGASGNCSVSGTTVHVSAAGSCTITASQAGNTSFDAAASVPQTFVVARANQSITVSIHAPGSAAGGSSFAVSASAPGGSVTYSSAGACTNSGGFFTTTSVGGTCTVRYDQAGSTNYNAAVQVAESVNVTPTSQKQNQTITFDALPDRTLGDDFTLGASASSGLAVSYAASGTCTVSGANVHLTAVGSCAITASQAGNANFNAAASLSRTFKVTAAVNPPPTPTTCTVPKLAGRKLAAAKQAVKAARCTVGLVTYTYSTAKKKGTVLTQTPGAGRSVAKGATVDLVVGSGPAPAALVDAPITNRCTRIAARLLLVRYRLGDLGDPKLRDPVSQVLCGTFFGRGTRGMAVTLAIPACGRTGGWVVFRWTGKAWKLVMKQKHGADLAGIGSQIRETQFVFRSGDTHCNPTGGTRSRTWRWNGRRFAAAKWKRSR